MKVQSVNRAAPSSSPYQSSPRKCRAVGGLGIDGAAGLPRAHGIGVPADRVVPVIASHSHRFIFLKTRKTAGTSVEIALSKVCGPDDVITEISPEDEALRRAAGGRGPQNFESPPLPRKAYNHMGAKATRELVGHGGLGRLLHLRDRAEPVGRGGLALLLEVQGPARAPRLRDLRQRDLDRAARPTTVGSTASAARWPSTGCCATSTSTTSSPTCGSSSTCPVRRTSRAPRATPAPPGTTASSTPTPPASGSPTVFADTIEAFGYEF